MGRDYAKGAEVITRIATILSTLTLSICGCSSDVTIVVMPPVEYCDAGNMAPCVRGDAVGVCYLPGVCAASCVDVSQCEVKACRVAMCQDGACVYAVDDCN
jgi:hypothetical protein